MPIGDYVESVTCADAEHCWAVGSGIWATSDGGTTWAKQSDTQAEPLTDISCTDAVHCWTVGFGPTSFAGSSCTPPTAVRTGPSDRCRTA